MLNNKNSLNNDNRNLSEVFKELQEIQNHAINTNGRRYQKPKNKYTKYKKQNNNEIYQTTDLKLSHIITGCTILIVAMAILFPKNLSFKESYAKVEEPENMSEYEINRHRLNMQNIISGNSDIDKVKEQITDEREVEFETNYQSNATLPKGEEIVIQEGVLGTDSVTAVRTYENGNLVEEIILNKECIKEPIPKIIDRGTSEFLAKHKIHIGDTLYLLKDTKLKETTEDEAKEVAEIKQSLDVKLLELPSEEWCKVSFETIEGYVKTSELTSPVITPNIKEKNRIQKILLKLNIEMELNKPSGLNLSDYKKIFTGLTQDKNNIFEEHYSVFYNMEKKYKINGIFLAAMAIHESNWGTSQIALEKKNLFGYGSYDATPYESSFEFESYSEGIETVAKSLVKYYLNPSGVKIYDGETSAGWYYNGPTLSGVNTRYASDENWHTKVYSYMQLLYNKL